MIIQSCFVYSDFLLPMGQSTPYGDGSMAEIFVSTILIAALKTTS